MPDDIIGEPQAYVDQAQRQVVIKTGFFHHLSNLGLEFLDYACVFFYADQTG